MALFNTNQLGLAKDDQNANNFFDSLKLSSNINNGNLHNEQITNSSDPIIHRLDHIETNLNKVCNQHDALMPLLMMKEQLPLISKTENTLKTLQKRLGDNEEKFKGIEKNYKGFQKDFEVEIKKIYGRKQEKYLEIPALDKNLKGISNHINTLQTNLKDIEGKVLNLQKITDNRIKDESLNMNKDVDKLLELNKNEIQNIIAEFKNKIELSLKKQEEVYKNLKHKGNASNFITNENSLDKDKLIEDIHNITSAKIDSYIENIKTGYEKDVNGLYQSVGGLRCEMERLYDQSRKEQMMSNLKNLPKDAEITEKKVKINNLEQSLFLTELEKFNKDNTQRINYELQTLEEKIEAIKGDLQSKSKPKETIIPLKQEMEFLDDRFSYIKYQIEGAKKKYLYDMKRIEEKMDKLNSMRKKMQTELSENPKLQRTIPQELELIESFPDKIKKQMESINSNLELSYKKLKEVDEKLLENKDLIKKSPYANSTTN